MPALMAMLTKDVLYGMNILTLAGFAVMGVTLHLGRIRSIQRNAAFVGMTIGTALVFIGLYATRFAG